LKFGKILLRKKLRADLNQGMLALFGAGPFAFQFTIQKLKD
jgi:hypothetical protein